MASRIDKEVLLPQTILKTREILSKHKAEIASSPWRGLTELSNKDGAYCSHSCPTQAWSASCLLEVLYDLDKLS
jgi:Amylo-alpha-1,6-glucosidase.